MLEFFYFPSLPSTQKWLLDYIKHHQASSLICVMCEEQTQGIGSRDNQWERVENALTFSFAFLENLLPSDVPLQSVSIYVGFLFKQWLFQNGFDVWLKWPNDLYLKKEKIGGVMTQRSEGRFICGIGLNLCSSQFASFNLNYEVEKKKTMVKEFLEFFLKFPSWAYIFENYKLEFHKNFDFTFHFQNRKICFSDVKLCEDGSVIFENQKIYSLR